MHYRLITSRVKNGHSVPLVAYSVIAKDEKIVSNAGIPRQIVVDELGIIVHTLTSLHTRFLDFPTICWDMLPKNDTYAVLEGNAPGAVCWKQTCTTILQMHHQTCQTWVSSQ